MVIDHNNKAYRRKWGLAKEEPERKYSELISKAAAKIKTDRDFFTVNVKQATDRAIVVIHSNNDYDWLKEYKGLILICKDDDTAERYRGFGETVTISEKAAPSSVKKKIHDTINKIDKPAR